MGNVTISTSETTIYYPSDWLIQGGPPYDVMDCPDTTDISVDDLISSLSVVWNDDKFKVLVGYQEFSPVAVVMESTNIKDVLQYFKEYMEGLQYLSQVESAT